MKVMVVEDEPLIRLGLVTTLEDNGFDVLDAGTADGALAAIRLHEDVGLIITDVDVPGTIDGVELANHVRAEKPSISIIVISGKVSIDRSLPPGVPYISKPYHEGALVSLAKRMINA